MTRRYTVEAVDRALVLLDALAESPNVGVTELAKRLGLTKTLVFRLVQTLEARGFVAKDEAQARYSLGYHLAYLGSRVDRRRSVLVAAGSIIDVLRDRTDENVNLVIREGTASLCVATRESRQSIRLFAHEGRRGPLHAGGCSTLLLAFAPGEVIEAVLSSHLEKFTENTLTDPDEIRSRLAAIRREGFHVAWQDLDAGAFSIAVPIWGQGEEVVASISVAGPITRFDPTRQSRHLEAAREAAAEISARLGRNAGGLDAAAMATRDADAA